MGDDDLIYSIGNISSEHDDYSVTYTSTGDDKITLDHIGFATLTRVTSQDLGCLAPHCVTVKS